jgi:hypothetical protein
MLGRLRGLFHKEPRKPKQKRFDSLDLVELTMALEEAGITGRIEEKDVDEIVKKLREIGDLTPEKELEFREALQQAIQEAHEKGIPLFKKEPAHRPSGFMMILFWMFVIALAVVLWKMASSP